MCDELSGQNAAIMSMEEVEKRKRRYWDNHFSKALRYNVGKPQLSLVDLGCLEPCAHVLEYGATKYSRDNWKKGMKVSTILDSLLRHIADLQQGKIIDAESQQLIIGHIQCNALFLGNIKNNIDDISINSKDSVNGVNCS